MIKNALLAAALLLALFTLAATPAIASAAAWEAYTSADITGVYQIPQFADDVLSYTVYFNPNATISIPENSSYASGTYKINWIQSFVVLGSTNATTFTATGNNCAGWDWIDSTSNDRMYGWAGNGGTRLYTGESKTLTYTSFDLPAGTTVIAGIHFGYGSNGKGGDFDTGFFRCTPKTTVDLPETPELPGSVVFGLGTMLSAAWMMVRRRMSI